jgi:hypothetical protein
MSNAIPDKVPHFNDFDIFKERENCPYCSEKKSYIRNVFPSEDRLMEFKFYWELLNTDDDTMGAKNDFINNDTDKAYIMDKFIAEKHIFFETIDLKRMKTKLPLKFRFCCERCYYEAIENSQNFGWNFYESLIKMARDAKVIKNAKNKKVV